MVYDKTRVEVDTKVDVDEKVDITTACPELPEMDDERDDESVDSFINQIRLPREQVEISKTSKVSDNTVDQTSNIMSAAAKVDLGQNSASGTYDEEDDKDNE